MPDVDHKPGLKPCCLHLMADNTYLSTCSHLPWVDSADHCTGVSVNCRQVHGCWSEEEGDECTTCDVYGCLEKLRDCKT